MGVPRQPGRLTGTRPAGPVAAAPVEVVRHALADLPEAAAAVVAVSGGPDSVGLLLLVAGARPDLRLLVAHVRHGLRDDAADAEAARAAADALDVPVEVAAVRVGVGEGPEDAARTARWAALRGIAARVGAAAVLVGHTLDDQAETVLLRIARGTGPTGLAGMAPDARVHGARVLRPLLGLRRDEVRAVPAAAGVAVVEDPTNRDPDQRRARVRADALPALGRLHPDEADVAPLLARLADLARGESAALDAVAATVPLSRYGPAVLVPRHTGVVPAHPAILARLLRDGLALLDPDAPPPPRRGVNQLLALPHGRRVELAGGVVGTASASGWALCPPVEPPAPVLLDVGDRAALPSVGVELHLEEGAAGPSTPGHPLDPPPWVVEVVGRPPLHVGVRGEGGARDARRALQALVPAGLRHLVPLVRDADGRLLAVGSHALDAPPPGVRCLRLRGYPAAP